jgi:MFS family permease
MASADQGSGKKKAILTGITTNVLVLGIVSLLTDVSSEMIYPILPMFLGAIGASALVIGLIEGAAETTASLLKVVSGWYSDRFKKRKPFITAGYGTSTLVKPLLALAVSPWQVLGLRIVERVGKGIRSAPRDALIADSVDKDHRGIAYGFHKSMDSTGAVIGPILVLPILLSAAAVTENTYRTVFLLSTIPALLAVLVIIFFVRDKETSGEGRIGKFSRELRQLGRPFYLLLVIVIVFYLGEISYVFFILRAYDAGLTLGSFDKEVSAVVLYILYNVIFVIVAMPAGKLSDMLGRKPVIALSFSIFAITCLTMAFAETLMLAALGFALFGVYKGSSEGVLKAYVVDVAPGNLRGTALGGFHTAMGLVMLPGGIIAGLLYDALGPQATFAYGASLAISALVLLLVIGPGKRADVTRS